MPKSSQPAGIVQNLSATDLMALHAYIDQVVAQRLATTAGGARSPPGQVPGAGEEESDDEDDAHGPFQVVNVEDSEDEELPALISRSPSLAGVDLELVDAVRQIQLFSPEGSLSPTSSNLVPADVRDRVLEAMARESSASEEVGVLLSPQPAAPAAPQPVAPAATVAARAPAPPVGSLAQSTGPYVPPTGPVPAAIPLVPGFHSLFGTPAPAPEEAVFAGPNDGPFYVVTRGVRIGVMSGWDTVSPYVTKVSGAVHQKKKTLIDAYRAYHYAHYHLQSTMYI